MTKLCFVLRPRLRPWENRGKADVGEVLSGGWCKSSAVGEGPRACGWHQGEEHESGTSNRGSSGKDGVFWGHGQGHGAALCLREGKLKPNSKRLECPMEEGQGIGTGLWHWRGWGVLAPGGQERPRGHQQPLHAQRHTAGEASVAQPCTMAKGTAPFQVQQLKEMIISRKETPLTSIRELICT